MDSQLINVLFLIVLFLAIPAKPVKAGGPLFRHPNPQDQQEWDNVYQNLASVQTTKPYFIVYPSSDLTNVTGNNVTYTVAFNTKILDSNSNYSTSTFKFTAPKTGAYCLCTTLNIAGLTSNRFPVISIVTSKRTYTNRYVDASSTITNTQTSFCIAAADMTAGDTASVQVVVAGGAQDVTVGGTNVQTFFSGFLVN